MAEAPPQMSKGWFISYLHFYDVQSALVLGTGVAVAVAMAACLAVLLLATLDLVVSLLAVITVLAIICVTLAVLVLSGWHLNVLESVTVSAAVGLAVDLTLHYGVAYRLAPEVADRQACVAWASARLASPAFMAAATSAAAGTAMLGARVLPYIHVGAFLATLAVASWLYATFLYLPLLATFGPQGNCGRAQCCKNNGESPGLSCSHGRASGTDKAVYQQTFMSESTLSTSSAPTGPHGQSNASTSHLDAQELEPLNYCSRIIDRSSSINNKNKNRNADNRPSDSHDGTNGVAGGVSGILREGGRCSRSKSLSSSVPPEGDEARAPRKASLPSPSAGGPTGDDDPSPRHSVGPGSSVTTILYSEPDSESTLSPRGRRAPSGCDVDRSRSSVAMDSLAMIV